MEKGGEGDGGGGEVGKKKMMRTDTFPFRVPAGPTTIENDCSGIGIRRVSGSSSISSDLYLYGGAGAATTAAAAAAAAATTTSPLQPFPSPTSASSAFGSPGMATASFRFPFTLAQWQELERQAMIYKYMMASVPIPPDLLVPKGFPDVPASHYPALGRGSCFNLRFSNSVDPEPGRCRRTDGKKWRCSRDVAPEQKYCERHMHRGRPRSRKPVEVQSHINHTRPSSTTTASSLTPANPTHPNLINGASSFPYNHPSDFLPNKNPFFPEKEQPRYVDWMNGGSETLASSQAWQLMEPEMGLKTGCGIDPILVRPPYDENLSLNFSGFGSSSSAPEQNDHCCLFLNSDLSSIEDPIQKDPPLRFIDAWSIEEPTTTSTMGGKAEVSSGGKFPVSSLTLSMPSCEDDEHIYMGLGVADSDGESNGGKHTTLSWTSPIPLLGGPLGEVLQSTASAGSNSLSPHSCGGLNLMSEPCIDGCSPHDSPSRQTSSPTGVLRRTLASLSDSSGCSSPTFVPAKLPGQIAFLN